MCQSANSRANSDFDLLVRFSKSSFVEFSELSFDTIFYNFKIDTIKIVQSFIQFFLSELKHSDQYEQLSSVLEILLANLGVKEKVCSSGFSSAFYDSFL